MLSLGYLALNSSSIKKISTYKLCASSCSVNNLKIPVRNTREADRPQFRIERYQNMKYKNSPFYKGVDLWKELPLDIINSDSIFQFKKKLKHRYTTYLDV